MNKQQRFEILKDEIWQNYFFKRNCEKAISLDVPDIDDCLDGGIKIGRVHLITGSGHSGAPGVHRRVYRGLAGLQSRQTAGGCTGQST